MEVHFISVRFKNYKALKSFSASFTHFNVLVGPNNAGKSTILGAFRILAEGLRKAKARNPEPVKYKSMPEWGYRVNLDDLPVSTENIFSDYNDNEPASVNFRLSNGNELELNFPEVGTCFLLCKNKGKPVRSTSDFRKAYPISIGLVPVLGPVDHHEHLYQQEAARKALLTYGASRNFRNIWHYFPDEFEIFRTEIQRTWPGMDINKPEVNYRDNKPMLSMFCPEKRFPREIYWAGFGFQVWCQMLTYILRSKSDSLLIIDEPDIYLHSDLQRQLVGILQNLGPDIIIATHSTEIITEAEPNDLLVINKTNASAKRIKNSSGLQQVFTALGSSLNPTLTQLAKTRRVLFLEGKDFQIISTLALRLGKTELANRSDFAIVPVDGFNSQRVIEFTRGMELTLGTTLVRAIVFDRDYRCEEEISEIEEALKPGSLFVHIHLRKELENYLLDPIPLIRAIQLRLKDSAARTGKINTEIVDVNALLYSLSDDMKHEVSAQYTHQRENRERKKTSKLDVTTVRARLTRDFECAWADLTKRLSMVSGKEMLSKLNEHLQHNFGISVSPNFIAKHINAAEMPSDMVFLINQLEIFRTTKPV